MNDPSPPPSPSDPSNPSDPYTPPHVSADPGLPPPAAPPAGGMDGKQWAMLLHLSQLAGVAVPGLGLAAPILIWQLKKAEFPGIDPHGIMVANWIISLLIYCLVATVLSFITCGVGALLFLPILVVAVILPIIGGLKARDGILWKYPLTIAFIK